ncbi:MAG TPA: DUF5011 domain-containing protein [Campylobacterales bacterium]|nr:DUF5011 domain-containing protein [Campylobacterales bacterium]
MKIFLNIIIFLTIGLNAIVYEDAQDKTTKGWSVYNNISNATIKNVYDKEKKSRVILLGSKDSRTGYMLELERDSKTWCKSDGKSLHWSMKTQEDFVIFISIQTIQGHRSLIYTASEKNGKGYYGLGKKATDGTWHKFSRDLDLDLKRYEPSNRIIAVDTFFIRGNMKIDDVAIVDIKEKKKKKFVSKKPKDCNIYVPKLNNGINMDINDVNPPVIKLNGYSPLYIKLGKKYIEQGATARDDIDGVVDVEVSGSVDINRVGTYTIFYMAKDRIGNTSITTRIINVGFTQKNKNKSKSKSKAKIENNKNDIKLDNFSFDDDELLLQEIEAQD